MGSKGPLVILGLGVLAMASLGFMANFMMSNSPVLKRIASYRETVRADFPVERVVIRERNSDYEFKMWLSGDVGRWPEQGLPSEFESLGRHFYMNYLKGSERARAKPLAISLMPSQGYGCTAQTEAVASHSIDFQGELTELKARVAQVWGVAVSTLEVDSKVRGRVNVVVFGRRPAKDILETGGGLVSGFLGGGWTEFQIRFSDERVTLDGEGKVKR